MPDRVKGLLGVVHLFIRSKLLWKHLERMHTSHVRWCASGLKIPQHIKSSCEVSCWQQQLQSLLGCSDALQHLQGNFCHSMTHFLLLDIHHDITVTHEQGGAGWRIEYLHVVLDHSKILPSTLQVLLGCHSPGAVALEITNLEYSQRTMASALRHII